MREAETNATTHTRAHLLPPPLTPTPAPAPAPAAFCALPVFLNMTADRPDMQRSVVERTKGPLIALMTCATQEIAYLVLKHMHVLVQQAPGVYDDEYASLFVRYSDALYVQRLKIQLLALVTNDSNFIKIVDELGALVSPHDAALSQAAIQALGEIGCKRPRAAPLVADKMCSLLLRRWTNNAIIQHECISVAKDMLRKFAPLAAILLPVLTVSFQNVEPNTRAQVSLVWVLGQFAADIPEAPYLLETMIDGCAKRALHRP